VSRNVRFSEFVAGREQRDRGEETVQGRRRWRGAAGEAGQGPRCPAHLQAVTEARAAAACSTVQARPAADLLLDGVVGLEQLLAALRRRRLRQNTTMLRTRHLRVTTYLLT